MNEPRFVDSDLMMLIACCFTLLVVIFIGFMARRIVLVHDFRVYVIELCYRYNVIREVSPIDYNGNALNLYFKKMPSYQQMVWSFKIPKLDIYFPEESVSALVRASCDWRDKYGSSDEFIKRISQ